MSKKFMWSPTLEEQVKHLYLNELLAPIVISERTGVPLQKIYNKINGEKWAKVRKKIDKKIGTSVTKASRTIVQRHTRFLAKCVDKSEAMVERGFRLAESAESERAFSAAAGATRTFLDIYRKSAGLDANNPGKQTNVQINFAHTGPFAPKPVVRVSTSESSEADGDQDADDEVNVTPTT